VLGLDGIHRASSSRIGPRASARSSRLTTIGLSRRFLAGSNAAADNNRIGNARSLFTAGFLGRGFDSRRLHQSSWPRRNSMRSAHYNLELIEFDTPSWGRAVERTSPRRCNTTGPHPRRILRRLLRPYHSRKMDAPILSAQRSFFVILVARCPALIPARRALVDVRT
jgi:hypothetical protein